MQASQADARAREAAATIPVYGQLPFVPVHASGCDIITGDGRRILDLYGGHAVAALGYGHPRLVAAIRQQSETLLFQSNAVALDVRAQAAEKLVSVAPASMERVFFANSGAHGLLGDATEQGACDHAWFPRPHRRSRRCHLELRQVVRVSAKTVRGRLHSA
jgi:acetylornithine/succinyldiaminopimelate/putrescine aminotransferase